MGVLPERGGSSASSPLAPAQLGFWLLDRLHGGAGICTEAIRLELQGSLDLDALEAALAVMIRRHDPLRTSFDEAGGLPRATVARTVQVPIERVDLSDLSVAALDEALERQARQALEDRFDLERPPLLRVKLLQLGPRRYQLLVAAHHLVTDGTSLFQLFPRELGALYSAFARGEPEPALPQPPPYEDFARIQQREATEPERSRHLAFWRETLRDAPPVLRLPSDRPRPRVRTSSGGRVHHASSLSLTARLDEVAERIGVRRPNVLLAAWVAFLSRSTGQTDVVLASPLANRDHPELASLFGCLIDNLIIRVDAGGDPTFAELAARTRAAIGRTRPHRGLPSSVILESLASSRSGAHHPIYQVSFNYMPFSLERAELHGLETRAERIEHQTAILDLSLEIAEGSSGPIFTLEYSDDLFERQTAERMLARYLTLLEASLEAPSTKLSKIPAISTRERLELEQVSAGPQLPRESRSFSEILRAAAEVNPSDVAVIHEGRTLDYSALLAEVSRWAAAIRAQGAGPRTFVAIALRDPWDALLATLGVAAAGAAFVPLHASGPRARAELMLRAAQPALLIADEDRRPVGSRMPLLRPDQLPREPAPWAGAAVAPDDPAYVLFTSGSTGTPKGVVVLQRNISHQHLARQAAYPHAPGTFLLTYGLHFDAGLAGAFWTLACGGTLVLADEEARRDPRRIRAEIVRHEVTHLDAVPALYAAILEDARAEELSTVEHVVLGGEELPPALARRHFELMPHARLFNEYGPTEVTVFATTHEVTRAEVRDRVAIGRPIANTWCWVTDPTGELLPIGQPGELRVSGDGVAGGYLDESTGERPRFVGDPLRDGAPLYRTGDRVRWRADGRLEFLGRVDRQVKVRGVRIELGEVEQALLASPGIGQAAVMSREEGGSRRLIGYIVPSSAAAISTSELRRLLRTRLPEAAVPSAFVVLDALPIGANGKIDFDALPAPEERSAETRVAPRDPLERKLASLWERVLGVRELGVHDGFFELGGHSLAAVALLGAIERELGKTVVMADLLRAPTIAELAQRISELGANEARAHIASRALDPIQPRGHRPPLFFVGSVQYARALAAELGVEQPIYGLNIFALSESAQPGTLTVEAVARVFLEEIRRIQPRGPYHLAGYCADAKVAHEMAVVLRGAGETVGFLGFIDAVWWVEERAWGALWSNLRDLGPGYLPHRGKRKLKDLEARLKLEMARVKRELLVRRGRAPTRRLKDQTLVHAFYQALDRYEPAAFDGRISLLLASEWGPIDLSAISGLAREGIEVTPIRGYHDTLFERPQISALAAQIRRALGSGS